MLCHDEISLYTLGWCQMLQIAQLSSEMFFNIVCIVSSGYMIVCSQRAHLVVEFVFHQKKFLCCGILFLLLKFEHCIWFCTMIEFQNNFGPTFASIVAQIILEARHMQTAISSLATKKYVNMSKKQFHNSYESISAVTNTIEFLGVIK